MKLSFPAKTALALGVMILVFLASSFHAASIIDRLIEDASREGRAQETIALAEQALSRVASAEESLRAHLRSGNPSDRRAYSSARAHVLDIGARLDVRTSGHLESVRKVRAALDERIASLDKAAKRAAPGGGIRLPGSQLDEWRDMDFRLDALMHVVKQDVKEMAEGKRSARMSGEDAKRMILFFDMLLFAFLLGAVIVVICFERKRTRVESELRDSDAMSRAISESMAEGVITSADGIIVSVNKAAVEIFGYDSVADLVGRPVTELVPRRQRDDFGTLLEMLTAREENFRETALETRGMRKNGEEFSASVSFGDVFIGGRRLFTGIVADITGRKRIVDALRASETRLREITDAVPALIYYANSDRRITFHNRLFEEYFDLQSAQIMGRHVEEILGPDIYESVRPHIDNVLNGYPVRFERMQRTPMGVKDLAVHYYPRYHDDDPGTVVGYVALITDITDLKRVDRMKSEFVSTVSHELRTPLTSIRGSLGLIAGGVAGNLPDSARNLVDIAKNNCERLIRLINDILDTEKIESGKMRFELEPQEMKPLLEQVLAANEGLARQHKVSFVLSAPLKALHALVDTDRIVQVVTNLISNAVKFSPAGGTVEVILDRSAGGVRVQVRDDGPGVPESFRARIFQKFSQADASDTRTRGGTGLGLNISRTIVERHGGRIGFRTQGGVGSTFFFDLPEAEAPSKLAKAA